ncbi:MAG TPA: phosphonate metabolism protein/1,5-bisphosphokinase (PRPP-forming) PhnN [Acetobacteraceae bacterium]|nr:phosphonate metabolism protein/1,5-bisphosphokinase (PRPP-forming) PhnN [Acetobacteraceae bacterium]
MTQPPRALRRAVGEGGEGVLVLVVGPSGAGKDTLLKAARQALADDPRFRFVRRVITRAADAGGEAHEAITEAEFATRDFALQWQAHGLRYGIPTEAIAGGIIAVANVSRSVIAEAAERFPVRVIEITAPPDMLAARLMSRGREAEADVAARLARSVSVPNHVSVNTVLNDGVMEDAVARFLAALNRAASGVPG